MNRREFLGAASFSIIAPELVRGSAANSAVRVGLLGCGGRGSEDVASMAKNGGARVVAIADIFPDQLDKAKERFGVASSQMFSGIDAAQKIANSKEVDAVSIGTPPYFHPEHLAIIVAAGKHVYCEKPVAVDVAGAKRVIELGKQAEGKLSLDVGFQIRNAPPFVELVKRIHGGALGEIVFGSAYYYCSFIGNDPWPPDTPARQRLRNWIHDRVLSGDIVVEQNIHVIDICNWVLQGHPVKATASCSRKGRPDHGNCNGSYSATLTYPGDLMVNFCSRQVGKEGFDANERFFGTKGSSQSPYSGPLGIEGDNAWKWAASNGGEKKKEGEFSITGSFSDNLAQADAEKHKAFIESITSGKYHNQAALGAESSLSAMLIRKAAYEKREVTWEELIASNEKWDAKLDLAQVV
jgi:myo-inositol 2-dehydrogenase / D-chiro-inositol 1-dehydrogenase